MTRPKTNPGPVDEMAPTIPYLTDYDHKHLITYLMLLDAVRDGIDREEIIREVLQLDPSSYPDRAVQTYESHLARARWMSAEGYRQLLKPPKDF